jgi:hypothetical protein
MGFNGGNILVCVYQLQYVRVFQKLLDPFVSGVPVSNRISAFVIAISSQ